MHADPKTLQALHERHAWGRLIRQRRRALDLTLTEVAARMKSAGSPVTSSAVGAWERGTTTPRGEHLQALALALETTRAGLFDIDELAS